MGYLEGIKSPADVKKVPRQDLQKLAEEIRARLIDVVSETGGHIGAGLGVVELTTALNYVFESPRDKILWDVGHQGYPWKIMTGRNDQLHTLRQEGGLSGFLRRDESEHDAFGAGHAGTALSAAFGMAAARDVKGEDFDVVAVAGDGALTCGLSYEGMNNAGHSARDIIFVVNDNGMSIAPNVGAINKYLGSIISSPIANRARERVKGVIERFGDKAVDLAKNVEESVKNLFSAGMLFEELGFRYFGPIDGHDVEAMVKTFEMVKELDGPKVVHVITSKGKGFPYKDSDHEKFHARAPYDPVTGELTPVSKKKAVSWTAVFGQAITDLAAEHPEMVVVTAAMPSGTGTNVFQKKWPERFFDVGIAEGHATTFSAGMATQGLRPIVAIYSTFLQRGFDNIVHDVAIQNLPVIFCMDRAGMVGADGQTHMGLYDIPYMTTIPNMTVAAPRDAAEMIGLLRCALKHDGPFALRYPRDNAPGANPPAAEIGAVEYGSWEILREGTECAILATGVTCEPALEAAEKLVADGFDPTVVNCRFIKPMDEVVLKKIVNSHHSIVTVEDGTVVNGFGAQVAMRVDAFQSSARVVVLGAGDRTWEHAARGAQIAEAGYDADGIANTVRSLSAEGSLTGR